MVIREPDVLVVGGGVVGLFAAYHLRRAGAGVIVLERGPIGGPQSCSHGNTGFVGSHGAGPLRGVSVKRVDLDIVRWLWRFRRGRSEQAFGLLLEMKKRSLEVLRELSAETFAENGMIIGFKTPEAFDKACRAMPGTVARGVPLRVLDTDELRELEPETEFDICGAAYNDEGGYVRVPDFLAELSRKLTAMGVDIRPETEVIDFEMADSVVRLVRTSSGDFRPDEVVIAAGAWSKQLARRLDLRLDLLPVKGYGVTLKAPAPRRPVTLAEARIAVAPLGDRVRLGAVRELAGFDTMVSAARVDRILHTVRSYLPQLTPAEAPDVWIGFRPCTPDGLPLIGRVERYRNLSVAAGHGHIGMGLAPASGRLLAQIVTGEPPEMDPAPFRVERRRHAA